MFDQILQMVQQHIANNPQVAAAIPAEQTDAIHQEIASHITNGLQAAPVTTTQPVAGDVLSSLESTVASGGFATGAIEGVLVSSLGEKFGLPPAATGAIAGMLPGLLQKFVQNNTAPNVVTQNTTPFNSANAINELENPMGNSGLGNLLSGL
jgi:hypothetical protein